MISTASLIGIKTVREDQILKTAAEDFKSIIKLTQTNAFASVQCLDSAISQSVPTKGWKVKVNRDNGTFNLKTFCLYENSDPTGSTPLEQPVKIYPLNPETPISHVSFVSNAGVSGGVCDIDNSPAAWTVQIKFDPVTGKTSFEKVIAGVVVGDCTNINYKNLLFEISKDDVIKTIEIEIDILGKIR